MKQGLQSRLLPEISVISDMQMIEFIWQNTKRTTEPLEESEKESKM